MCCVERLVEFADLGRHAGDVEGLLVGLVGDTQTTADVDELEADIQLGRDPFRPFQQHAGGIDHIAVVEFIRGDHGVQAETFGPASPSQPIGVQ